MPTCSLVAHRQAAGQRDRDTQQIETGWDDRGRQHIDAWRADELGDGEMCRGRDRAASGEATWLQPPPRITATRSDMVIASTWSWVT